TAADAAAVIGVEVGQIVKSLVFGADGEVVVALVSGDNLLDERKLADAAGVDEAWREDADTVRETTGFPVGGVPPFGHREPLRIFVDEDLLIYDELWAAAGTPHVNFPITPSALLRATGGTVCDLARR
ncbi:MAG: YbaK/EbsC family protein, partial [Acidimicrobiales bacterium]